jgi:outer membrane protein OmpA-like peptidoglycan-associated protein
MRGVLVPAAIAALVLSSCSTNPETGETEYNRMAIGAGIGALSGAAVGALVGDGRGAAIGAIGGGIAGAAVGGYMDAQQRELEESLKGSGVDVVRDGDNIYLNMPGNITFATDRSEIRPEFYGTLNDIAATLAEYDQTTIDVAGHTDNTGSADYNQGLSERRALSVADYISAQGVQHARINIGGFGETRPIASNTTAEGRQENRRVEISITPVVQ